MVICKILGLFINILTADDKYSLLNRDNLLQHLQMQWCQKQKTFPPFFAHFRNLDSILKIFKKKMTLIADNSSTDGRRKTWSDKCLKSPISEEPSTSNIVNWPKHCWNLNSSTFTIFIDHCGCNSVGKNLS